jgi:hypothetical protein
MKQIKLTADQSDIIREALENRQNELEDQVELGFLDYTDIENEMKDIDKIIEKL